MTIIYFSVQYTGDYKIITQDSWFWDCVDNGTNILKIPYGKVFMAPEKNRYKYNYSNLVISKCGFHFANGVFDTMAWNSVLYKGGLFAIYEIEPIGDIKKGRCSDAYGLYQCCAPVLRILKKQDLGKMCAVAEQEYYKDPNKYPNVCFETNECGCNQIVVNFLHKLNIK